jgi:hypothetical protein
VGRAPPRKVAPFHGTLATDCGGIAIVQRSAPLMSAAAAALATLVWTARRFENVPERILALARNWLAVL